MPHLPSPYRPGTGLTPVPAAILLPSPSGHLRPARLPAGRLSVAATCRLVATYTRAGEAVADLDSDPNTTAAVAWLDRTPITLDADQDPTRPYSAAVAQLVIARLPPRRCSLAARHDRLDAACPRSSSSTCRLPDRHRRADHPS